jgi:mono/diheme cytochrome c family protein
VTEIPEHLLKRSRDRRAALGLGGGEDAGGPAAAAPDTTPATTAAAAPEAAAPTGPAARQAAAEPAAPPPPPPDPPYVVAAKSRAKIPFFAMAALSLMPIWVFMYVRALTEPPEVASGPLGIGAEVYSGCVSCHGTQGEGGPGRPLADGEVLATFPNIEDQLRFVYFGSDEYDLAGVENYGDPDREGGANTVYSWNGQPMPQQGSTVGGGLTDDEILAVVCHERFTLGGADPTSDEYLEEFETWCAEEAPAFLALEAGGELATLEEGLTNDEGAPIEIVPIGSVPVEGSPP